MWRRDGPKQSGKARTNLWWFCSKRRTRVASSKRAYSFWCASPTDKSDARLTWGISQQHCRGCNIAVAKLGPLTELSASLAISIDTLAAQFFLKASVRTYKRHEKERDSVLQHRHDGRRLSDSKRLPTLRCGWTYSPTQKWFLLLRPKEDYRQKGVGSKINGQEGVGIKWRQMTTGDSENRST